MSKCNSCGKEVNDTHTFCMYCGVKQKPIQVKSQEYITYFGDIKVKKTTTTLVGFFGVLIMVAIGGYFFTQSNSKSTISTITTKPSVIIKQNNPSPTPGTVNKSKDNTYLIKGSDKYPITQEQLKGLTKDQLAKARNEILARHGYVYKMEPYKSYFNSKSWYKANPNFKGLKSELSPLERHNIKEIMTAEGTKPEANYDSDYHVKKD